VNDYVKECNQFELSPRDFERVWCVRCQNESCQRSKRSSWALRMETQMDVLFNPERADPDDPQYEGIRRQEFKCLNPQEGHPTVTYPIVDIRSVPAQFEGEEKPQIHVTEDEEHYILRNTNTPKTILKVGESEPEPVKKPVSEPVKKPVSEPEPKKVIMESETTEPRMQEMFIQPGAVVKMGG